jgi:hypothetical protein
MGQLPSPGPFLSILLPCERRDVEIIEISIAIKMMGPPGILPLLATLYWPDAGLNIQQSS